MEHYSGGSRGGETCVRGGENCTVVLMVVVVAEAAAEIRIDISVNRNFQKFPEIFRNFQNFSDFLEISRNF